MKLFKSYKAASMVYYGILLDPAPGNVLLGNLIVGFLSVIAGPIMCLLIKLGMSKRRNLLMILYITTASLILLMGKKNGFIYSNSQEF